MLVVHKDYLRDSGSDIPQSEDTFLDRLETLPKEIFEHIFKEVPILDFVPLFTVSKRFNKIAKKGLFIKYNNPPIYRIKSIFKYSISRSLKEFSNYFGDEKLTSLTFKFFTIENLCDLDYETFSQKFPNLKQLYYFPLNEKAPNDLRFKELEDLLVEATFKSYNINLETFPKLKFFQLNFPEETQHKVSELKFEKLHLEKLILPSKKVNTRILNLTFDNTSIKELGLSSVSIIKHNIKELKNLETLILYDCYGSGGCDFKLDQLNECQSLKTLRIKKMIDFSNLTPLGFVSNLILSIVSKNISEISEELNSICVKYPSLRNLGLLHSDPKDSERYWKIIQEHKIDERLSERSIKLLFGNSIEEFNI